MLHRSKHGVTTTIEGQQLFEQISNSLDQILDATVSVRAMQAGVNIIKVSSLSSFALKWLVPRHSKFQNAHPEIILDISIADDFPDFENNQKDCAIVSRPLHLFDKNTKELFEEELIVVAAPSILKNSLLDASDDLHNLPLIHTTSRPELWQDWNEKYNSFNQKSHILD